MPVAAARDRVRARMEEAFRLFVALDAAVQLGTRWLKDVKLNVDNVALQRRHILVRNVIEHAGGVLRPDAIRPLRTHNIELLDADHAPVIFRAGDRLVLTVWAVRPVRHLAELADELAAAAC